LPSRPRVGLLHYTCSPVIGGVETILGEQARRLAARGYPTTVIAGRGGPLSDPGVTLITIPELDSRHPEVTAVREALMEGNVPPLFAVLESTIRAKLQQQLASLDVLIVHNVMTLHFNLPLTTAIWTLAGQVPRRTISWIHDLSWANALYRPWMHEGEPWNLLRRQHPDITSIFVSRQRLEEWRELSGTPVDQRQVIPNGIDAGALLRLGPVSSALAQRLKLFATDVLLLAPVRITKRKNLEWAIEAAAGVRRTGKSVQLLITGPPGPHNPQSIDYAAELKRLAERLGLQDSVRFLFEEATIAAHQYAVDTATLADLYMLSDVVVLPSASEGFGLPVAEAAMLRVPVVCTDLPAFREVAPEGVSAIPLEAGSAAFTAAVLAAIDKPTARLRRHVLAALDWDRLITDRIEPLLAAQA
jgi:glycosyltransferase involved in cell wall biosynthesis